MRDDNDTNLGMAYVYDTPEEKEIERLSKITESLRAELSRAKERIATLEAENTRYELYHLNPCAFEDRCREEGAKEMAEVATEHWRDVEFWGRDESVTKLMQLYRERRAAGK